MKCKCREISKTLEFYLFSAHEDNFSLQMAKLGCGLMNGEYSIEPNDTLPISNEDQVGHVSISIQSFLLFIPIGVIRGSVRWIYHTFVLLTF